MKEEGWGHSLGSDWVGWEREGGRLCPVRASREKERMAEKVYKA